jgi:hypothetical protein
LKLKEASHYNSGTNFKKLLEEHPSMTRISKQAEKRMKSPHKRRYASKKTGSKKDNLSLGFKEHANVAPKSLEQVFIPKIA